MFSNNTLNSKKRVQSISRVKTLISFTALTLLFPPLTAYAMDLPDPEALYERGMNLKCYVEAESLPYFKLAAKQGHAKAQYQVANIHYNTESWAKACKYYKLAITNLTAKGAEPPEPNMLGRAHFHLGKLYDNDFLGARDRDKAYEHYTLAEANGFDIGGILLQVIDDERDYEAYSSLAKQGNLEAQIKMGKMFKRGRYFIIAGKEEIYKDIAKALNYLTSAANQGHLESRYLLGKLYEEGGETGYIREDGSVAPPIERQSFKLHPDPEAALKHYHIAADTGLGNAEAQLLLSKKYAKGEGVAKDDNKALNYLHAAAAQGHPEANLRLGLKYETGEGIEEDENRAVKYYRIAADLGNAEAQALIGSYYSSGDEQNNEESLRYLERAGAQKNPMALCRLGLKYFTGEGVPQDYVKALKYFTSNPIWTYNASVYQGCLPDQTLYSIQQALQIAGLMYEKGKVGEPDFENATYYYGQAADQGNAEAQYWLANLYANGTEQTPQDFDLAFKYFELVAAHKIPADEPQDSNLRKMIGDSFCKMGEIVEFREEELRKSGIPLERIEEEALTKRQLTAKDLSILGKLRFEEWEMQNSDSSR